MRSVTLVCGPPAAGKTTWARGHAAADAVVLDWDDFARAAGSTARWNHSAGAKAEAEERMQAAIHSVAEAHEGTYFVIRSLPVAGRREALAEYLRADRVVVLLPPFATLMARARERSNFYRADRGIRTWLSDYSPSPNDELIVAPTVSAARCSEEW